MNMKSRKKNQKAERETNAVEVVGRPTHHRHHIVIPGFECGKLFPFKNSLRSDNHNNNGQATMMLAHPYHQTRDFDQVI